MRLCLVFWKLNGKLSVLFSLELYMKRAAPKLGQKGKTETLPKTTCSIKEPYSQAQIHFSVTISCGSVLRGPRIETCSQEMCCRPLSAYLLVSRISRTSARMTCNLPITTCKYTGQPIRSISCKLDAVPLPCRECLDSEIVGGKNF